MSDPVVTSVSPTVGPAGTTVACTGTGFKAVTGLSVGGISVTPTIVSDTELRFSVVSTMPIGADDIVLDFTGSVAGPSFTVTTTPPPGRSPLFWPGGVNHPVNVPIKTGAIYVDAKLPPRGANAIGVEKIVFNMDPTLAVTPVYKNSGQHDPNRCLGSGGLFSPAISLPYNQKLLVPSSGLNYPGGFVDADGVTRWEAGNVAHCTNPGKLTAGHMTSPGSLIDDSFDGASGGSGLSTILGTIRVGEFLHGTDGSSTTINGHTFKNIRHALRFNLYGKTDMSSAGTGFRWPATHPDGGYNNPSLNNYYGGTVPECVEGSRLAIRQTVNLATMGLTTTPGYLFAWILQMYGGYPCNDAAPGFGWPICMETSALGDAEAEFATVFGTPFAAKTSAWGQDAAKILAILAVVDNNTATSIGGVGTPLQPLAPAFS
jgi:IPT/TIG domain